MWITFPSRWNPMEWQFLLLGPTGFTSGPIKHLNFEKYFHQPGMQGPPSIYTENMKFQTSEMDSGTWEMSLSSNWEKTCAADLMLSKPPSTRMVTNTSDVSSQAPNKPEGTTSVSMCSQAMQTTVTSCADHLSTPMSTSSLQPSPQFQESLQTLVTWEANYWPSAELAFPWTPRTIVLQLMETIVEWLSRPITSSNAHWILKILLPRLSWQPIRLLASKMATFQEPESNT